jgi:hypothetical protein
MKARAMTKKNDIKKVILKEPLPYGDKELKELSFRKPKAGDLRGVSLVDIGTMKPDALFLLLPRISTVAVTEAQIAELDPHDTAALLRTINAFFE